MRSPAAALAWEFGRRHRWGLAAVGLYFAALAAFRILVLTPGERVTFEEGWQFGLVVIVPLASTFTYFLAIFSFGLDGDLGARRSLYPTRMFPLPITSGALAGWPMLYGTVAMGTLWLVTRLLAVWPSGAHVPWLWPALFAAVFLAWTQALVWLPYPLRGLRVMVTILWLTGIGATAMLALHLRASEGVMLALLAPLLPPAYLVARFAVARARRGEVMGRRPRRQGRASSAEGLAAFPSPTQAQTWFEGRQRGHSLPIFVAILLPPELALLFLFREEPSLLGATLAGVFLTPPFLAAFGARRDELTSFSTVRPVSSAGLLRTKFTATLRSTLITWLLVLGAVPLALALSGTGSLVADGARKLVELVGAPRAVGLALLGLGALMIATWKRLVQALFIGLSGSPRLVKASVFGPLVGLTILVPLVSWILERGNLISWIWDALPWLLAVLVLVKGAAAARVAQQIYDQRLLRDRTLLLGALGWCVAVLALYAVLLWLLPSVLFPNYLSALVAILAVPLVRPSAALPALARNRHR